MPVRNALRYLDAAVESVLAQTRGDFEFVIYDDASDDGSSERLEHHAASDKRIRLVRGSERLGPALSSNAVVEHSRAPLIARMDADDISMPDRLERQSEVMAAHPEAGIVASLFEVIGPDGRQLRGPEPWRLVRKSFAPPFPHGSMMIRRSLFDAIGGYRPQCAFWEDLDFVIRASDEAPILVIPTPLYRWRHSDVGTRLASRQDQVERALDLRYQAMDRIGLTGSYDELLGDRGPPASSERIDPRVFVSIGALELWARDRPRLAKRFLARARLGLDRPSLFAGALVALATVSPGTLRALVRLRSRIRDQAKAVRSLTGEPTQWRPWRRPGARPARPASGRAAG